MQYSIKVLIVATLATALSVNAWKLWRQNETILRSRDSLKSKIANITIAPLSLEQRKTAGEIEQRYKELDKLFVAIGEEAIAKRPLESKSSDWVSVVSLRQAIEFSDFFGSFFKIHIPDNRDINLSIAVIDKSNGQELAETAISLPPATSLVRIDAQADYLARRVDPNRYGKLIKVVVNDATSESLYWSWNSGFSSSGPSLPASTQVEFGPNDELPILVAFDLKYRDESNLPMHVSLQVALIERNKP